MKTFRMGDEPPIVAPEEKDYHGFYGCHTTIDDLANAGWVIESNEGGWYFRNKTTRKVLSAPYWVHQLMDAECKRAVQGVQSEMRRLLGIDEPSKRSEITAEQRDVANKIEQARQDVKKIIKAERAGE